MSIFVQDFKHIISVRDRVSVTDSVNNLNTNKGPTVKRKRTLREVQHIAHQIEGKLGKSTPSRFPYFCKVAWRLPENKVWLHVEAAMGTGCTSTPTQLFIWLCQQEPEMLS